VFPYLSTGSSPIEGDKGPLKPAPTTMRYIAVRAYAQAFSVAVEESCSWFLQSCSCCCCCCCSCSVRALVVVVVVVRTSIRPCPCSCTCSPKRRLCRVRVSLLELPVQQRLLRARLSQSPPPSGDSGALWPPDRDEESPKEPRAVRRALLPASHPGLRGNACTNLKRHLARPPPRELERESIGCSFGPSHPNLAPG